MLNLPIVMIQIFLSLFLVLFTQTAELSITSPQEGQILRGKVEIAGNLDIPNFSSAELAFAYVNSADNWFTIQTFFQPIKDAVLATWDTSPITDADYTLRLRVFLQDGSFQDVFISNLKVRNDMPTPTTVPTITPTATSTLPATITPPAPTDQPAPPATAFPSPLPLPANPASVTTFSIYSTFARGGLVVLVLFIVFSLLLRIRKN